MADLRIDELRVGPTNSDSGKGSAIGALVERLNRVIRVLKEFAATPISWSDLSDKPTTAAEAGLTDVSLIGHKHVIADITDYPGPSGGGDGDCNCSFDELSSHPSTLDGYGITDAARSDHTHSFDEIQNRPTTLAEYGIIDAAPIDHNHDDRYYTKGISDILLAGKVNRTGGDFMHGFEMQPDILGFDMEVPFGHRLNLFGHKELDAHLEVTGHLEAYA